LFVVAMVNVFVFVVCFGEQSLHTFYILLAWLCEYSISISYFCQFLILGTSFILILSIQY
jgi:hypothetical protein